MSENASLVSRFMSEPEAPGNVLASLVAETHKAVSAGSLEDPTQAVGVPED